MSKVSVENHNIDSATSVDINTVKLSDLTIICQTGSSTAKGFGENRVVTFRAGMNCRLGNVAQPVWEEIATQVIARDLGDGVLEKVEAYIMEHGNPIVTYNSAAVYQAALNMCTGSLLRGKDWEEYEGITADFPELAAIIDQVAAEQ